MDLPPKNDKFWPKARDIFWCKIQCENPYPVDPDQLSVDAYNEATIYTLKGTIWEDWIPGETEIRTVSDSRSMHWK
jgi:hypothetical protein